MDAGAQGLRTCVRHENTLNASCPKGPKNVKDKGSGRRNQNQSEHREFGQVLEVKKGCPNAVLIYLKSPRSKKGHPDGYQDGRLYRKTG